MDRLDVLSVVSEIFPLVKTGGLADVAGALPFALAPLGVRVRTLIPGYPPVLAAIEKASVARALPDWYGGPARLLRTTIAGLELYVLDAPHLYNRAGGPYVGPDGRDFPDNAKRFAALCRMGASIGQGLAPRYRPQVIHTHDWQAGLTAAFLHFDGGPRPPVVATIHNLAFQGQFGRELLASLGLPPKAFSPDGVEYYGDIGFLKAAVRLADRVTTVSPTYAAEICTAEGGMGLQGLLRGRSDKLVGILNGIDTAVWDPAADPLIAQPFGPDSLAARPANKTFLQARFDLTPDPDAPLFGVVSRLSWQKGLDLLLEALPTLLQEGGQLALLGSGDAAMEAGFAWAAEAHPGRVGCVFSYDEALAHEIQAGSDCIVVPSRFESLSLLALEALAQGTPVLVNGASDVLVGQVRRSGAGAVYRDDASFALGVGTVTSERVALGARGRAFAAAHTWESVMAIYREEMARVLAGA